MATLPDIPLDKDLIAIYKKARDDIARDVKHAVINGERVDISETLSDLSELDIATHYEVSQQLSTELEKALNDTKKEPQLQEIYRQCQQQILTQEKVIYAKIYIEITKKSLSNSNDATYKIDLSENLKQLSNVTAKSWIFITEKLSTELKNAANDPKTEPQLQERYRQCLSQIDSLPIPEKVAVEYNQGIENAIGKMIPNQYNRTYIKRNILQETNDHNMARIERIKDLTHQLLSQKSSVLPGKTITYGQLQARELLIRKLTKTQGKEQTKVLISTIEGIATGYKEKQTKDQEATSTVNDPSNEATAPTRNQSVIASKNNDLLEEAGKLVLSHCNLRSENNNL